MRVVPVRRPERPLVGVAIDTRGSMIIIAYPLRFRSSCKGALCMANFEKKRGRMAKIDLDAMNIDELASLRDRAIEKLAEKVEA